jgi:hypothetical protein
MENAKPPLFFKEHLAIYIEKPSNFRDLWCAGPGLNRISHLENPQRCDSPLAVQASEEVHSN